MKIAPAGTGKFKSLIVSGILAAAAVGLANSPNTALAASDDECAIWLCVPGGFPAGCGAAKAAMMSRIKKRKPPIPSWGECFSGAYLPGGGGSSGSANMGPVAYIPEHTICVRWRTWGKDDNRKCLESKTIPEEYRRGVRCRKNKDEESDPPYCTKTMNYMEIIIDGQKVGDTYIY